MLATMRKIMSGEASPVMIAALTVGLRVKKETVGEITAAAQVMREFATKVEVPDPAAGEVLIRNTWISVDPYMRNRMNDVKSYVPPFQLDAPLEDVTHLVVRERRVERDRDQGFGRPLRTRETAVGLADDLV